MITNVPEIVCCTLLHFLWQATAIAVMYKCIDWCLPSLSARKRYSLALMTLLAMFAAGIGTATYEAFRISHLHWMSDTSPFDYRTGPLASAVTRFQSAGLLATLRGQRIPLWVDAIWSFGVLVMSVRALGGLWFVARLRASMCVSAPERLLQQLSKLRELMNIKANVGLRVHAAISSPFVLGAVRPVIYVPLSFLSGLTSEQIEIILVHELAHIARADYVWNIVQVAMETLFFFHPAVWWIGRVVRDQREHSCDDIVLESFARPAAYVAALLVLAESACRPSRFAMGLSGHDPSMQLFPRVARILGIPLGRAQRFRPSVVLKLSVPAIAGVALLYCTLVAPIAGLTLPRTAEAFSQTPASLDTRNVSVPVSSMSQRRSRAVASRAKSIADELAPKQASEGATEQAARLADTYVTKMRASPSIVQISPSVMRVSGTVIDAQALAKHAVPSAVAEQLKLHPQLRLDHRSVIPSDENLEPDEGPTSTNTTTRTDTTTAH